MKGQSICLNMIVKNESHVIRHCIASVKPYISSWVIVDTGSTDGTQEIIRNELQDIPGTLYERPWVNFALNRNEALELAKTRADFLLFVDADEIFSPETGFVMPELVADCYDLPSYVHETRSIRTRLVRSLTPFRWEGVLHECLR